MLTKLMAAQVSIQFFHLASLASLGQTRHSGINQNQRTQGGSQWQRTDVITNPYAIHEAEMFHAVGQHLRHSKPPEVRLGGTHILL